MVRPVAASTSDAAALISSHMRELGAPSGRRRRRVKYGAGAVGVDVGEAAGDQAAGAASPAGRPRRARSVTSCVQRPRTRSQVQAVSNVSTITLMPGQPVAEVGHPQERRAPRLRGLRPGSAAPSPWTPVAPSGVPPWSRRELDEPGRARRRPGGRPTRSRAPAARRRPRAGVERAASPGRAAGSWPGAGRTGRWPGRRPWPRPASVERDRRRTPASRAGPAAASRPR